MIKVGEHQGLWGLCAGGSWWPNTSLRDFMLFIPLSFVTWLYKWRVLWRGTLYYTFVPYSPSTQRRESCVSAQSWWPQAWIKGEGFVFMDGNAWTVVKHTGFFWIGGKREGFPSRDRDSVYSSPLYFLLCDSILTFRSLRFLEGVNIAVIYTYLSCTNTSWGTKVKESNYIPISYFTPYSLSVNSLIHAFSCSLS